MYVVRMTQELGYLDSWLMEECGYSSRVLSFCLQQGQAQVESAFPAHAEIRVNLTIPAKFCPAPSFVGKRSLYIKVLPFATLSMSTSVSFSSLRW